MAKIRNFDSFGGPTFLPHSHISATINVKFGTGSGPLFHVYRGNGSPLRGETPIFGPLSKNNTSMAALRAGLPVIIIIIHKGINNNNNNDDQILRFKGCTSLFIHKTYSNIY